MKNKVAKKAMKKTTKKKIKKTKLWRKFKTNGIVGLTGLFSRD